MWMSNCEPQIINDLFQFSSHGLFWWPLTASVLMFLSHLEITLSWKAAKVAECPENINVCYIIQIWSDKITTLQMTKRHSSLLKLCLPVEEDKLIYFKMEMNFYFMAISLLFTRDPSFVFFLFSFSAWKKQTQLQTLITGIDFTCPLVLWDFIFTSCLCSYKYL